MGNLCTRDPVQLNCQKGCCVSGLSSTSSFDMDFGFELHYWPASGEGESLKVLFSYLEVPYKEVICSEESSTKLFTSCYSKQETFECLKYVSKVFGIYPKNSEKIFITDSLCELIIDFWRNNREFFYRNNQSQIRKFYHQQVPGLVKTIEKNVCEGRRGLIDEAIGVCDILVLTFVYNLFFIRNQFIDVLNENGPKLKNHCVGLLHQYGHLEDYFRNRPFHLYI